MGKYVEYLDHDGKNRINKVVKITGNTITVKDSLNKRRRIHLDRVLNQVHHGHCKEKIVYNRRK